jgi:hypothetical protein
MTGLSAELLNQGYTLISDDPEYLPPALKHTAAYKKSAYITDRQVFKTLECGRKLDVA